MEGSKVAMEDPEVEVEGLKGMADHPSLKATSVWRGGPWNPGRS